MATSASKTGHEKRLLAMRKDLLGEITEGMKDGADEMKKDLGDMYDLASNERERELSLLLGHRGRDKLAQIDDALSRIQEGSYGVCDECGLRIGAERVKAMPFTRLCIECQSELERTTMMGPDLDTGRNIARDIQIPDLSDDD